MPESTSSSNLHTENEPLRQRWVVVTGSSSGIGAATARRLAQMGANVVLHGRRETERITELAEQIRQACWVQVDFLYRDFSTCHEWDESDWDAFISPVWNDGRDVFAWINNAGGDVLTGDWKDRTLREKLNYLIQVDVEATLFLSRAVGRKLTQVAGEQPAASPPVVVNIGWDQAAHGMEGESGSLFATTKGAIMAMTRSLAQDFAPHVRFNCVAPGWIQTAWGQDATSYWQQRAKAESLLDRWGSSDDVAGAIAMLCSDNARFVNGQIIPVNGGFRYGQSQKDVQS